MKKMQKLLVGFMLGALMMSFPVFGATSEVYDYLNSTHSELDPEVQAALDQIDLEALEQQVAALGLGEGDQLVAVISEEGEVLELGALEVQVASTVENAMYAMFLSGITVGLFIGMPFVAAGTGSVFVPIIAGVVIGGFAIYLSYKKE